MDTTLTTSINELTAPQAAVLGGFLGSLMVISLVIGVLFIIAGWKVFTKAGEKGWKILIPIYDLYILFKICGLKKWFWGLLCISIVASILMCIKMPPVIESEAGYQIDYNALTFNEYPAYIIGLVISCVASVVAEVVVAVKLARAFGKGVGFTLGLIFFPYIFTLILAFGKSKYSAKNID